MQKNRKRDFHERKKLEKWSVMGTEMLLLRPRWMGIKGMERLLFLNEKQNGERFGEKFLLC